MRSTYLLPILLVLLLPLGFGSAEAQEAQQAQDSAEGVAASEFTPDQAVGTQLPSRVRILLIREMVALQQAMNQTFDALIRGEDETVAEQAQSIRDSFILKQEMTPDDRKALLASVPEAFVTRDRAFHALGGQLAEAARQGNRDEQLRLYGELATACAQCHAQHARDRFPGLGDSPAD